MNRKHFAPKALWEVLKDTYRNFREHDVPTLGAALSYFTIFSLAPILVIAISIAGLVFGQQAVHGEVQSQIKGMIGADGATQVENMIKAAYQPGHSLLAGSIAFVLLILGAIGVFGQIKNSLNTVWQVKPKPKLGIKRFILDRVLSFGMIVCVGFLLLMSMVVQSVLIGLTNYFLRTMSDASVVTFNVLNVLVSNSITLLLLALTYKFMSDAKIKWRDMWIASGFTTILFSIGRYLISYGLAKSNYGNSYGAAGSIVLVLVWVFYSSQIFLFGAEFSQAFAASHGAKIIPKEYAVRK